MQDSGELGEADLGTGWGLVLLGLPTARRGRALLGGVGRATGEAGLVRAVRAQG